MEYPAGNNLLDIQLLIKLFSGCCREEDVWLLPYFGKLFYFVNRDVEQKLRILYEYHESNPTDYKTINIMTKYEHDLGITGTKHIGCRTLLRLHRALLFVIELMTAMCSGKFTLHTGFFNLRARFSNLGRITTFISIAQRNSATLNHGASLCTLKMRSGYRTEQQNFLVCQVRFVHSSYT
ncbi:unnamed protein product [Echinostoma caproni]|uniref:GLTP domain-containing protein n=1 Tax=Echinostoma caproni TaxID=27848 RepID=A0A183A1Y5_9TREM|nr:unnamed protein product [Echinostoma caproni]